MQTDDEALEEINRKIGEYEDDGKPDKLGEILAPRLAFQRADPKQTVDDRVAFLQKVEPKKDSDSRRTTKIVAPILYSGNRAVVQCIVSRNGKDYHNIRLFVRRDGGWKLLGWANEEWPSSK